MNYFRVRKIKFETVFKLRNLFFRRKRGNTFNKCIGFHRFRFSSFDIGLPALFPLHLQENDVIFLWSPHKNII